MSNSLWARDEVQFPRLLDRAEEEWERLKEKHAKR